VRQDKRSQVISTRVNEVRDSSRLRTAVVYRVCQHWRMQIFKRLADNPQIKLKVFHGEDIPGTKLVNAKDFLSVDHQELKTFSFRVKSSGRSVPIVIYPGILKALNDWRPDVLLCEGGSNIFNNLLVYWWAKRKSVPTIWWGLGEIPGRQYYGLSRVYQRVRLGLMQRSSVLLGYSTRATDYFKKMGFTQPIFKAVNCIDTEYVFASIHGAKSRAVQIRKNLDLSDKKVVLFVGALTRAKRLDDLLRAYACVRREINDVALLIVGDGPAREELQALTQSLQLSDIHFVGEVVDGVVNYFQAADLFVLPGLGGLAISEAMCHGLPIICTVADGCEEDLVREDLNGYVIPTGAVQLLADKIKELLQNPFKRIDMGRASAKIIQEEHNINSYMASVIAAIRSARKQRKNTKKCTRGAYLLKSTTDM